jgi:hypothetical protein
MQRIAAIFDGLRFSESTLHYAILLAKQEEAHLTGIFPHDFTYNSFSMYKLLKEGASQSVIREYEDADRARRDASTSIFEAACQKMLIPYNIHHNKSISLLEALEESIYADLMIIDAGETFVRDEMKPPTRFMRDMLSDVQCPVLVVPSSQWVPPAFADIEKTVMLYDGEPSSVFAIKMYNYLLPSLHKLPTTVLSVNAEGNHLANKHLVKEFIKKHVPHATYKVISGDAEAEILKFLQLQPAGTLAVLGAYRRGAVSRWFRHSMADVLMQRLPLPLFIAHNK